MQINLELFLRALALAIALESICWALFPRFMRKAMARLVRESDNSLRLAGASGLVLAGLIAFFAS